MKEASDPQGWGGLRKNMKNPLKLLESKYIKIVPSKVLDLINCMIGLVLYVNSTF
jgi:hypothetical protein